MAIAKEWERLKTEFQRDAERLITQAAAPGSTTVLKPI